MPVEYVVGRAGAMLPALARCAREAILLDRELIILVPRQLTLETEIALFDALGIEGSFRLQICSTARFLARVFEETGAPEGERIDEQGRAMALAARRCTGRPARARVNWCGIRTRFTGAGFRSARSSRCSSSSRRAWIAPRCAVARTQWRAARRGISCAIWPC